MDLYEYQACVRAFADQRYEECLSAALPMLAHDSDLELLQIVLISLQRLGKTNLAAKVGADALRLTNEAPWDHSLLRLTLGQIPWPEVVFQAADSHQRCQVYYYAGARSLTVGENDAAIHDFLACKSTKADCLEFELAGRALRILAPREGDSLEDGFEVERLRVGHNGVVGEVRLLRPKGSEPLAISKSGARLGGWLSDAGPAPGRQVVEEAPGMAQPPAPRIAEKSVAPRRARFDPVKVFVSSTFYDMQAERDVLVNKTFPQLKQWCTERGLDLIEVDLRWGIAEGDILSACFWEIDQCRYFVGLLGSRYGSLPDSIHEGTIGSHPWLRDYGGRSMTELEIVHRQLSNPEALRRSFFYFRSPDSESSADAVGGQILFDLTEAIGRDYPSDRPEDPLAIERAGHEALAAAHIRAFIARQGYSERLDRHVRMSDRPILIVGAPGSGKSAFLADWVRHHCEENQQDIVIEHYVGATTASADCASLIKRLCAEMAQDYQIDRELAEHYAIAEDEADPGTLLEAFQNYLHLAWSFPQRRLVLVLDALDQLQGSQDDGLWWLPRTFAGNVKVILSARTGPLATSARERGWVIEEFEKFTPDELSDAAVKYLRPYGKELGKGLAKLLKSKPQACDPLYLRVLLNELRVFGSFDDVGAYLSHCLETPDLAALYQTVLRRWQRDYNDQMYPRLVEEALSLLLCSRQGLTENEWTGLLRGRGEPLPRAVWSPLFLVLQPHLINRSGLWSFAQEPIRQAVAQAFAPGEEDRRQWHRRLADYFASADSNNSRADELPWHLPRCGARRELKQYLSDIATAERFLLQGRRDELFAYWNVVCSPAKMVAIYKEAVSRAEAGGLDPGRLGIFYLHLAEICVSVSQLEEAEHCYRRASSIGSEDVGPGHPSIAAIDTRLGRLLLRLGRVREAEECLTAALHAGENGLGPIDMSLYMTLQALSDVYEAQGSWNMAARLRERAFEICRFLNGDLHKETASSAVRLSVVLLRNGQTERAEELCKSVLLTSRQLPGPDNPITCQAMDVLAEIHLQRKQYREAESLYQKIFDRRRETLGLDNPSTAMTLGRLGLVKALQGDRVAGSRMCREALDISHRAVGPDHPTTTELRKVVSALSPKRPTNK
jgi:tetratricopeptide (TPR) repeat protein